MARRAPLSLALLLTAAAALSLGACRRKAPGPDECLRFAYHVHSVNNEQDMRLASVRAAVDELTRDCLVTPYDREYLRCIEEVRRVRSCQAAFARRQAEK